MIKKIILISLTSLMLLSAEPRSRELKRKGRALIICGIPCMLFYMAGLPMIIGGIAMQIHAGKLAEKGK
jgi:hypothetical protein